MKFLLDQNLSPRLVISLTKDYPDITHVQLLGLDRATDTQLWEFAKKEDFVIVSKDNDFVDFSELFGSPPKVVWLQIGNCVTSDVEQLLIYYKSQILQFFNNKDLHYFILNRSIA